MAALTTSEKPVFTSYQKFVLAILAFIQFTVVLDFMVLSPLGAVLMQELNVTPSQFGLVVSAYAFSAGGAGLLAAGFADKFDRKKLLLFFYAGFVGGTFMCGIAPDYYSLLIARIVTGLFGGVISSISFAIVTDLFAMEVRGRVMGIVQMSFAVSQVLGIPVGLLLANHFGWHSPFLMIVGISVIAGAAMAMYMKPIAEHLKIKSEKNPLQHLAKTVTNTSYLKGFLATILLATGGFMLMPFGSAFSIHNLGMTQDQLPILYGITGVFSMIFGPLIGKWSDKFGLYRMFVIGSSLSIVTVIIYTNMTVSPFWLIQLVNVVLFVSVTCRIITSSALMSAVPEPKDRGAFMSINSSVQQIAGGIATFVAGKIVVQTADQKLEHYDTVGYVVVVATFFTMAMMYVINQQINKKKQQGAAPQVPAQPTLQE